MKQYIFSLILFAPLTSYTMEETLSLKDTKGKEEEIARTTDCDSLFNDPYTNNKPAKHRQNTTYSTHNDPYTSQNVSKEEDGFFDKSIEETFQEKTLKKEGSIDIHTAISLADSDDSASRKKSDQYRKKQLRKTQTYTAKLEGKANDILRAQEKLKAMNKLSALRQAEIKKLDDDRAKIEKNIEEALLFDCVLYITDKDRSEEDKRISKDRGAELQQLLNSNEQLKKSVDELIRDHYNSGWFGNWLSINAWKESLKPACIVM